MGLKLMYDGAAMAHVLIGDEYDIFTNPTFAQKFMTAEDLTEKHEHFKVVPELLWSW